MERFKIQISLTEFIKTGHFDFIKIGQTKQDILNNHFPPEDWMNETTIETSRIWRYGNFELHFDDDNILVEIFNDYTKNLDGGESIVITDKWILENKRKKPTLKKALESLNLMKIDYIKKSENKFSTIKITFQTGVYLLFEGEDDTVDPNNYLLEVIGKNQTPDELGMNR